VNAEKSVRPRDTHRSTQFTREHVKIVAIPLFPKTPEARVVALFPAVQSAP
jgi:hypothetical protein